MYCDAKRDFEEKKRDLFVKTVEWCDNSQYGIKKIIEIKIQN